VDPFYPTGEGSEWSELTEQLTEQVAKKFSVAHAQLLALLVLVFVVLCCVFREKEKGSERGGPKEMPRGLDSPRQRPRSTTQHFRSPAMKKSFSPRGSPRSPRIRRGKEMNEKEEEARPLLAPMKAREARALKAEKIAKDVEKAVPPSSGDNISMPTFVQRVLPMQQFMYQPLSTGIQPHQETVPPRSTQTVLQGTTWPITLPSGIFES